MEIYKKPEIVSNYSVQGLIPLAAVAPAFAAGVEAIAGLSAAKAAIVGVAAGLAAASASKGKNFIDSNFTGTLTARKNFDLE